MVGIIILIYLLAMLSMCFIKLRVGIAMYLLYQILVPFVNINIGNIHFGINLINSIVFISLFFSIKHRMRFFEYKSLLPFIFLYFAQLLLIPFQTKLALNDQFNNFRLDIMSNLMLPFVMINVMKFDKDAIKLFRNVLLMGILIAVLYGIYLTKMPGVNPWLIMILPFNDTKFNDSYALAENSGRLFGRISSVFSDTQAFGLVLTLSFIFIYFLMIDKVKKIKLSYKYINVQYFLLLILTVISIFVCGIRAPIIALLISSMFYLLMERKTKMFIYASLSLLIIYLIIQQVPDLSLYVGSIFDKNSENVSGSSIEMRFEQFNGCLNIIKDHEFTGLGYGWTANYINALGDHPVLMAFESLLYVVLCNSGYLGIFIWLMMIVIYYKYVNRNYNKDAVNILLTLLVAYLSYSLLTGDYGYMKYFILFYVIIIGGQNRKINCKPANFKKFNNQFRKC